MPPKKGQEHLVLVTKIEGGKEEGAKIDGKHGGKQGWLLTCRPSHVPTGNALAHLPRNRDRDIRPCKTSKDRPVPNPFPHVLHSPFKDPM
jgi:hypothetical protein